MSRLCSQSWTDLSKLFKFRNNDNHLSYFLKYHKLCRRIVHIFCKIDPDGFYKPQNFKNMEYAIICNKVFLTTRKPSHLHISHWKPLHNEMGGLQKCMQNFKHFFILKPRLFEPFLQCYILTIFYASIYGT